MASSATAVAAWEQLLVLLYDCATLAESGVASEEPSMRHEAFLAARDATCRDAVADFQMRPPGSERVHEFMVLLRTVGVGMALELGRIPLGEMFGGKLLSTFPALFQVGSG